LVRAALCNTCDEKAAFDRGVLLATPAGKERERYVDECKRQVMTTSTHFCSKLKLLPPGKGFFHKKALYTSLTFKGRFSRKCFLQAGYFTILIPKNEQCCVCLSATPSGL
jgi:hypothetical protein